MLPHVRCYTRGVACAAAMSCLSLGSVLGIRLSAHQCISSCWCKDGPRVGLGNEPCAPPALRQAVTCPIQLCLAPPSTSTSPPRCLSSHHLQSICRLPWFPLHSPSSPRRRVQSTPSKPSGHSGHCRLMLQTLAALDNCQDRISLSDARHLATRGTSGIEVDVVGVGVLLRGVIHSF